MVRKKVDINGTITYCNEFDFFHREDGPAVEYTDGGKYWYLNGLYHRIGGPAMECYGGEKRWYKNGMIHRLNAPAIIFNNGKIQYWEFNKLIS